MYRQLVYTTSTWYEKAEETYDRSVHSGPAIYVFICQLYMYTYSMVYMYIYIYEAIYTLPTCYGILSTCVVHILTIRRDSTLYNITTLRSVQQQYITQSKKRESKIYRYIIYSMHSVNSYLGFISNVGDSSFGCHDCCTIGICLFGFQLVYFFFYF